MPLLKSPGRTFLILLLLVLPGGVILTKLGWLQSLDLATMLVPAVLWLGSLTLATWGGGFVVYRWILGRPPADYADSVITFSLGAGTLIAVAGLTSVFGLLGKPALMMLFAGLAAFGGVVLKRNHRALASGLPSGRMWFLAMAAGFVAVLAASTISPFYDQWNYHLAFPFQWLREGHVVTMAEHAYSYFPANMGLLYTYALAGPGAWAAQITHWWMGALTVAATAALAHRLRPGSGAIAAAIIATTPAVFEMATVCGTELGVAAFGTCAWLILLTHKTQRDNRAYVLVGILVGLAVGCKYLALANVALPLGLVMMAMSWPRTRNGIGWLAVWLRPVAITTVIAIGVAAPWAIRNMVATGNPVYPYLAGSLASSSSETADSTTDIAEGIGDLQIQPQRFRSALTLGTFERLGFAGKPGAVYLWLLPLWIFGLFRRTADPHSRLLFAAFALGVLAWALAPPFGRYLIPTLALGAAGIAAAFEQATRKMPRGLTIGLLCVMAIVMLGNINPFKTQYVAAQTAVTLGLTPEGTLLNRHVSHWPAVEVINALPADSRVLLIAEARTFGIDRDLVAQDPIGRPMLVTLCEQEDSSDEVLGRLREMGITHVLVNHKEADRMALYNHREDYLECDRPDAQQRLNEVLNGRMLAVWRLEHLELFVVPPPLEVPSG